MEYMRLQVRLDDETAHAVEQAARRDGVSVSEFTKRALQDRIQARSVREIARAVAEEVEVRLAPLFENLREIEPVFPRRQVFDRSCIDAELHSPGTVCGTCGGSEYTVR